MSKKYAICIGLNKVSEAIYGNVPGLISACNDAKSVADLLCLDFDFDEVIEIFNSGACCSKVKPHIKSKIETLGKGDLLVIFYSGHGTQVRDHNNDEKDKLDEAWCLYDGLLYDDDLQYLFSKAPGSSRIVLISDSCHSGTMSKKIAPDDQRRKFLDCSDAILNPKIIRQDFKKNNTTSIISLSGCKDSQYSFDGPVNGAFTAALLKSLEKDCDISYRNLFNLICNNMTNKKQTPQFNGSGSKLREFYNSKIFTV